MKKLLIAILILGTINFTGCSQKSADNTAVKETITSITATASVPAATTTSAAAATVTTSAATASAAVTAPATTTSAATAPAAVTASATAEAAANNGKQLGYVKKLYEENGSKYISMQYVQWLSGEEAIKAIMEDNKCSRKDAEAMYTDDHYMRYDKDTVKVKVSDNATYNIIKTGAEATKASYDEVNKALGETGILCDLTIKDNEVTDLSQRYTP